MLSADPAVEALEVARHRVPVDRDAGRDAVEAAVELDERGEVRRGPGTARRQLPSTPTTSVVTPWRTFGSWRGSARIMSPEWLWRSMKPGATTFPARR